MPPRLHQEELSHEDYRVGWICALPCEMAAAICMMDELHPQLPQPETDHNNYIFGKLGSHNVVVACLPSGVIGITSAARVAVVMRSTFLGLRFGLMVGIGGGAPSEEHDIRLGDVVVSRPEGASGGVIQYDFGKTVQGGSFVQTGSLNRPPDILLNAMTQVQTRYQLEGSRIPKIIRTSLTRYPRREVVSRYPGEHLDQLFHWTYDHHRSQIQSSNNESFDWTAGLPDEDASCERCDTKYLIRRKVADPSLPSVHYGLVASGNQVMRDGKTRERLRREKGILCFEMEAAGIVDEFPCLIIRGICDYADTHKNKKWQNYAATTAAAYGSELLSFVPDSVAYADKGFKSFSFSTQRKSHGSGVSEHRDDQDETILQSLAFGGMFSRRNNVERRHPQTCTWILQHERFVGWLEQGHGLLWIKGIPGAGKSTLMAFLHDYFRSHMKTNMCGLDFFFNGRGTELQKQFLGLLRCMIYQIFKEDETVRPKVRRLFHEKISDAKGIVQGIVWQQRELESLLCEAIEISAQSRDVLVFVDALDEAGTGFARNIALYFHRLNECITSQAGSAKFCISSRHYPMVITIPGTEIVVENFNRPDIEKFISENLPLSYLVGPDGDDMRIWRQLQRDLVLKASGSFQWTRLVVPLVEKQITDGNPVLKIYNTLQRVPEALHEAYSHVLQHVINLEDRPKSIWLFKWVCLAQRPLSITELQHAMAVSHLHPMNTNITLTELRNSIDSQDQIKRLVRALSGGLVEVAGSGNQSKVEPIHQSVADFLLAGGLAVFSANDHNIITFDTINDTHAMIFQTCLKYLQLDGLHIIITHAKKLFDTEQQLCEIGEALLKTQLEILSHSTSEIFNDELGKYAESLMQNLQRNRNDLERSWDHLAASASDAFERWPQLARFQKHQLLEANNLYRARQTVDLTRGGRAVAAKLIDREAPFLWYALSNLFIHAEKLSADYFVQDTNEITHLESILDTWQAGQKMFGNLNSDHHHPNSGTNLLHIAAAANVTSLAHYCLNKGTRLTINDTDAGGNTALHLAVSRGHIEMVEWLLKAQPDILLRNKENHTPLTTAFRFSCIPAACHIIHYCPRNAKHMRELDRMLGAAVLKGSEVLVKLLIGAGANVNARGINALFKAAKYAHKGLVHLLLEAGADINAKSDSYGGCLPIACARGHVKVVELLLERRAVINDSELRSGISRAKFGGHQNIVTLFRQFGIE